MENYRFASVALDDALNRLLDYEIPESFLGKVVPGMRVKVPVRKTFRLATVVKLKIKPEVAKVALIQELLSSKSLISDELGELAQWMSRYYCAPHRKVLQLFLPAPIRGSMEEKKQLFVKPLLSRPQMAELAEKKRGSAQSKVLDILLKNPQGILLTDLLNQAEVSRSPVSTLAKDNVLSLSDIEIDRSILLDFDFFPTSPKKLLPEQEEALGKILGTLNEEKFATHLLFGVTGSGKTEVYLQTIDACLKKGKSALFLVPEIALTAQTIERLRSRFKERIAILHHRLSHGERRDSWHKIQNGEIRLVVGPRSALFSPVKDLGLIIVDEEHDGSYKQEDDAPCFQGRDVAVMRGKIAKATVVLGSATPSIESYANAVSGKYILSTLKQRPDNALLPTVQIVPKGKSLFSDILLDEIKKRIHLGEQTLLFLNRRGFHTAFTCQHCGFVQQCPHCAISMTFHKGQHRLACHLCDYELSPPPAICPECKVNDGLKFKGAGTEQVERALHAIFPDVRTLRLDADTTRHKGSHDLLFKQFRAGKADVLIGTQMIAKGLHFPSVTLVGILNADSSLQIPDFRAAEKTFQLLTQVSGRAGRGALPGLVIIQSQMPDNPTIVAAANQDYLKFYSEEINVRQSFGYPPFSHLVKCTFKGPVAEDVKKEAENIRQLLAQQLPKEYEILPVAPCGHAKIQDQFRFHFLVKGPIASPVTKLLEEIKGKISFLVDVDPLSTFF
ncbi:MAG: primosomal protein N' [Verrucomicrobia bacterium]|nr:primosomal protein N' [Verrucomicrobiota bacterium]